MHLLVSCPDCQRQFDAGPLRAGDLFRCACGRVLETPAVVPHEAAVVRCSSCGAARQGGSQACQFCKADFTLHEQDLHTICPKCMTRISDRARHCHHCGVSILPAGSAGDASEVPCPTCQEEHVLHSRSLGEPAISVLECSHCAGLWLGRESFEALRRRAQVAAPEDGAGPTEAGRPRPAGSSAPSQGSAVYRKCPECGTLMNRANYGRKSGVIIDSCRQHGLWFDAHELGRILHWIRAGGAVQARKFDREEERDRERQQRLQRDFEPFEPDLLGARRGSGSLFTLGDVLGSLFDLY